jgi:predicted RNA-binding Zn ribbon-like protein
MTEREETELQQQAELETPTPWAERPIHEIEQIGGELCLNFTNTVGGSRENPKERLNRYEDLVQWSIQAGAVEPEQGEILLARAANESEDADHILGRARDLREAIYRIFAAIAADQDPQGDDLARLNEELERAQAHLRVVLTGDQFDYRFLDHGSLDRPLWPIARSAADLLVSNDLARVKRCGGHDCDWLFVDQSKNKSRRWCDMRDCGNRAKARRHYHRQKRARKA